MPFTSTNSMGFRSTAISSQIMALSKRRYISDRMWPLYLGERVSLRSQSCTKAGRTNVLQIRLAPLGIDVLADHAPVGGESAVGDLFGILFLLLLEKETVQNAAEEHRCPGSDPTVDQQPHPFCCLQGMCFRFVFFYRSDGETPSLLATV